MQIDHIHTEVGCSSTIDDDLAFNFHICINSYEWIETIPYSSLLELDHSILYGKETNNDVKSHPLPAFENESNYLQMIQFFQTEANFSLEKIRVLESFKKGIENWINTITNNLSVLDDETLQFIKQYFFRSREKLEIFSTIKKSITNQPKKLKVDTMQKAQMNGTVKRLDSKRKSFTMKFSLSTTKKLSVENLNKRNDIIESKDIDIQSTQSEMIVIKNAEKSKRFQLIPHFSVHKKITTTNFSNIESVPILRVHIQRGQESFGGIIAYDIDVTITGKQNTTPIHYHCEQRFRNFRSLWIKLQEINKKSSFQTNNNNNEPSRESSVPPFYNFLEKIKEPFPPLPTKSYLGLSLSDTDLSLRTRQLDAWFHDVCYNYRNMPPMAKTVMREFLKLDLTRPIDITVQDHLAWGVIEAPRVDVPIVIFQNNLIQNRPNHLPGHVIDQFETMSNSNYNGSQSLVNGRSLNRSPSNRSIHNTAYEEDSASGTSTVKNYQTMDSILETINTTEYNKIK